MRYKEASKEIWHILGQNTKGMTITEIKRLCGCGRDRIKTILQIFEACGAITTEKHGTLTIIRRSY